MFTHARAHTHIYFSLNPVLPERKTPPKSSKEMESLGYHVYKAPTLLRGLSLLLKLQLEGVEVHEKAMIEFEQPIIQFRSWHRHWDI